VVVVVVGRPVVEVVVVGRPVVDDEEVGLAPVDDELPPADAAAEAVPEALAVD
jgi:hypothetical protein